jgi:HD-like signal output (HDOD) protein
MIRNPDDLLRGCVEVTSLPMVYHRINEAINHPRASMKDIGRIIGDDTGLTVRLLKLVNSAFYGFPSKIETITQALVIIGTKQLRDLALATSIVSLFKGIPKDLVDMDSFWRHSIVSGIIAKILATYRRESNIERFLIAGMLHDVGRLILYKKMGDEAREALYESQTSGCLLFEVERKRIGFDHADLGRRLLNLWNLPLSLEEAVACHHRPHDAEHYPMESAVIHLSDLMANALQWGSSGERAVPSLDPEAWKRLSLPTSILSPALDNLEAQVNDVIQSMFQESERS